MLVTALPAQGGSTTVSAALLYSAGCGFKSHPPYIRHPSARPSAGYLPVPITIGQRCLGGGPPMEGRLIEEQLVTHPRSARAL